MRRAAPTTVLLLLESILPLTAASVMIVLGSWQLLTRSRIVVLPTEFLATAPAPRLTATMALYKGPFGFQAARKDIVTRGVLQGPAFAVRALLCIICRATHAVVLFIPID